MIFLNNYKKSGMNQCRLEIYYHYHRAGLPFPVMPTWKCTPREVALTTGRVTRESLESLLLFPLSNAITLGKWSFRIPIILFALLLQFSRFQCHPVFIFFIFVQHWNTERKFLRNSSTLTKNPRHLVDQKFCQIYCQPYMGQQRLIGQARK